MTSLLERPLREIAAAVERGNAGADSLAALAAARHDELGHRLDAYQVWGAAGTPRQARAVDSGQRLGPLGAIPVSVKDLFGVEGMPTWAGTARRLPAKWEREGPVVRELRRQGCVLVGKTRMVELAFGGLGTNPHWGTPRNPWDAEVHRVPGGSSCGAGVSVQEGSALVAVGTDTACSVRTPAAWTGTVGLKPTRGHWSTDGMVPLSPALDSVGILTRTVEDACWAFAALDPPHDPARFLADAGRRELRGLAIGVIASRVWDRCAADIVAPIRTALRELEAGGARLRDVALPEFDDAGALYSSGLISGPQCAALVSSELPGRLDLLHETVRYRLRDAVGVDSAEHRDALERRRGLIESSRQGLDQADVFVVPTVPITAPALAEVEALADYVRLNRHTSRATSPANMLELCAVSIPCGLDACGIPVGMQLIARHGEDDHLLACALAAERVMGTPVERIGRPPLCR